MISSKFGIGDIVKIDGYLGDQFEVTQVSWMHNTYKYGFCYQGFIYKVKDIKTNEIMDAFENEMSLVYKVNQGQIGVHNTYAEFDDTKPKNIKILWQEYEDNLTLYEYFKDDTYKQRADEIFNELNNNKNNNT